MQTAGMNRRTGKKLEGFDHLRQSIMDILGTRRGTRVMRRDYGSDLAGLVDRPMNAALITAVYAETAGALQRWEPRLLIRRIEADFSNYGNGQIILSISGLYVPEGRQVDVSELMVNLRGL